MQIDNQKAYTTATELEIIRNHLPLEGKRVLELGCGKAIMTRQLVESFAPIEIIATEVDKVQHERNLLLKNLPGVKFVFGGAEKIDLPEESVDVVIMLKSLHHVPIASMADAMGEIHRVLKTGGLAYISEPVYRGAFNDIMRLFHDEKTVRLAAFQALQESVRKGLFALESQIFFNFPGHFDDFAAFESRMINVTHTQHQIDSKLRERIRATFEQHMTPNGAHFMKPSRVDLLRKPQGQVADSCS